MGSLRIGGLMRCGGGAGSAAELPGGVTACGFARRGSDSRLVRATGVGLGSGPALWVSDGRRNRSSEKRARLEAWAPLRPSRRRAGSLESRVLKEGEAGG